MQPSLFSFYETDEDDDDHLDRSDLFAFYQPEIEYKEKLIAIVRRILGTYPLPPAEVQSLAYLLLFLQRLPKPTDGIDISFSIIYELDHEHTYTLIQAERSYLTFESGGSTYDPAVGHDSYTSEHFEFGVNGYRSEESPDWLRPQILQWFEGIDDLLSLKYKISIDDFTEAANLPWDDLTGEAEWMELALPYNSY